ncbi:MAG: DNA cytosine methyltransferase, partial [Cyclobacteriaceae bacterium]|nr:DNA cytosine methyltransferase [Cyclobacteriaceae bacterium]
MWIKNDIKFFQRVLLEWFDINKRDFPWRKEEISNYELILSEILLQRTKAETVAKYYGTFFGKYPDWEKLCTATSRDLEDILKPLGLYTHRTKRLMKIIQEYKDRNGVLPIDKNELQETALSTLYISNAYELMILKQRAPLLDVNMSRVLSRYFYPREVKDVRNDKLIQTLAREVIDVKSCKELNWAILDYAAGVCKSTNPRCMNCGLRNRCRFYELSKKNVNGAGEPRDILKGDSGASIKQEKPLKVVSLFSGCGGMDLGFEGDFLVHKDSVNELLHPEFVQEKTKGDFVRLKPTKFQTIFANDILQEARDAWVHYFNKMGYSPETYLVESIVDLVKKHEQGISVFPDKADIVTGGFPCQDFSLA